MPDLKTGRYATMDSNLNSRRWDLNSNNACDIDVFEFQNLDKGETF